METNQQKKAPISNKFAGAAARLKGTGATRGGLKSSNKSNWKPYNHNY